MAKTSKIERNKQRREMVKKFAGKRAELLATANDMDRPMEERFDARLRLAALPRVARVVITASSACRVSRCVTLARPG
jgi:small subunit ribosomal protein S14